METSTRPQGPKGNLIVGNLQEVRRDPLSFFLMCARDYGDFVPLTFGPKRAIFLNHPDYVEYVTVRHPDKFTKSPGANAMRPVFGNGLLISEGNFWQRQHDMVEPAFSMERCASYVDTMVAYTLSWLESLRDGETRDVHRDMLRLTLESMVEIFFAVDPHGDGRELTEALDTVQQLGRLPLDHLLIPRPESIPSARNRRLQAALRRFNDLLYDLIKERKADLQDRGDVLSVMLMAKDAEGQSMTNKQLRDDIVTIILSTETMPLTLAYSCYLLSKHPDVQARVAGEAEAVFKGETPALKHRRELEYTQMVVTEVLRLFPPIYAIDRVATEDLNIGGHTVEAGTTIFISQYAMHRDPRYYEDPEAFSPERWTPDFVRQLPTFAYFPMGAGPRRCLGSQLGINGSVLLLATMVRACRFSLVSGESVELQPALILRPTQGIRMVINRRSAGALPPNPHAPS